LCLSVFRVLFINSLSRRCRTKIGGDVFLIID
jgi:hypothetical protein